MNQKSTCTMPTKLMGKSPMLYLAVLFVLVGIAAVACGVESGDRRAARSTVTTEFHRSPVTAFEQLRVDLTKTEEDGCSADPADITLLSSQRVRLAIQLPLEGISQGQSLSIVTEGETKEVIYTIPGLEITGSGGVWRPGVTEVNIELESGARKNYDFNTASIGTFDILCDGEKVGTFTVTEG